MGGALVLHKSKNGDGSLLWAHTTRTMSVGYMSTSDQKAKVCKRFWGLQNASVSLILGINIRITEQIRSGVYSYRQWL